MRTSLDSEDLTHASWKRPSRTCSSRCASSSCCGDGLGLSPRGRAPALWKTLLPRHDAPLNFFVMRMGSQLSFRARCALKVTPSGNSSKPPLKSSMMRVVYSYSSTVHLPLRAAPPSFFGRLRFGGGGAASPAAAAARSVMRRSAGAAGAAGAVAVAAAGGAGAAGAGALTGDGAVAFTAAG